MKLTPQLVAGLTAVATAPAAAAAASSLPGVVDQALAWIISAGITALVSALAAAITKLTGAQLDAKARGALQTALTNAANAAIPILIERVSRTEFGQAVEASVDKMVDYVRVGAPGALARFGLEVTPEQLAHLRRMAEARLIEQLGMTAPDLLVEALKGTGLPAQAPRTRADEITVSL
jgi:hypothetical protein